MRGGRTIAARLRAARLQADLSQEKLGVEAGIDEGTVSARMSGYESGNHTPGPLILERIANVLGVPAPHFYAKDDDLAELILIYGTLSAEGQARALKAVRQLVSAGDAKNLILVRKKIQSQRKRAARR